MPGRNPKSQIPKKSQARPKSQKGRSCRRSLKFGVWDFFGIWILGFGIFRRTLAIAGDNSARAYFVAIRGPAEFQYAMRIPWFLRLLLTLSILLAARSSIFAAAPNQLTEEEKAGG